MMHSNDLVTLGAQTLPIRDLVAILLHHRAGQDDVRAAEDALSLVGSARDAALRSHPAGPRLLAAVERGRRAWMLPSPAGRRIRAPVDVAAVVAPRAAPGEAGDSTWALAIDKRMTLARVARVHLDTDHDGAHDDGAHGACENDDGGAGPILRATLAAGCDRVVVAKRRAQRAVPTSADEANAHALRDAAALVGVALVDVVLLADDGFCSLVRLGMLPVADARYR